MYLYYTYNIHIDNMILMNLIINVSSLSKSELFLMTPNHNISKKKYHTQLFRNEIREPFRKLTERNRNLCLALSQTLFILFVGNTNFNGDNKFQINLEFLNISTRLLKLMLFLFCPSKKLFLWIFRKGWISSKTVFEF